MISESDYFSMSTIAEMIIFNVCLPTNSWKSASDTSFVRDDKQLPACNRQLTINKQILITYEFNSNSTLADKNKHTFDLVLQLQTWIVQSL